MGSAMVGQAGFFDADERFRALSAAGDPLERLRAVVDFDLFRAELEAALPRADRSRGGRPPYDAVLMFRVLVLQALYTLSDEQTKYQLRDRLSFMRFAGLAPQFQRAKPRGKPMPAHVARGNASRARAQSLVKHVFAAQKRRMGLVVRSIGLVRATARITLANLAYNMRRLVWVEGKATSA
jgi:hypothetical protein